MNFPPFFILLNQHMNTTLLRWIVVTFLSCFTRKINFSINFPSTTSSTSSSLRTLNLEGHFNFTDIHHVAKDFGNQYHHLPVGVLHPNSVQDIATTIDHIFHLGSQSELTVAARGNGHSTQGQAQANRGVVVKMKELSGHDQMKVHNGKIPYIDVSGGELWINVLHESLEYELSPRSWTDYLYLTVGGTLSNAGISGQAFEHGPQISNVYQLEVVTGKGEIKVCSKQQNADLYFAVLGGLGQFGIITRARIALTPAPQMVKWIRVLYKDFFEFTKDQEYLISSKTTFDYVEGFVLINRTGVLNSWRSSFNPRDEVGASHFKSDGKTLFCLEIAKYYKYGDDYMANEEVGNLLSQLNFIPSTFFSSDVSYQDFLNRVHPSEMKLRSEGLWDVQHPWLNLLIPRSRIHKFSQGVFGNILTDSRSGLIVLYPLNRTKWDNRTSAVIPDEDIVFLVGFLWSVSPSSKGIANLQHILTLNRKILNFCEKSDIRAKQYLAHYTSQTQWKSHFGQGWESFVKRKVSYDPLAILAPGQRIFQKSIPLS